MGQWTLNHHDEVLDRKLKTLVAGACKRARLENDGTDITYETFIEQLDAGDSFTSSMIDILVKEVAERRHRNRNDRRLISERTAKSLRAQAAPLHIYRGRTTTRYTRRRLLIPGLDDLEASASEDDLELVGHTTSSILEGVRVNSELYDAFMPGSYGLDGGIETLEASTSSATTPDVDREVVTSPRPISPPLSGSHYRTSYLSGGPSSSTGVSGLSASRPTTRGPIRSRVMDFNDFTLRRRSNIRNSSSEQNLRQSMRSEDGADGPWSFGHFPRDDFESSITGPPFRPTSSSSSTSTIRPTSRRFFGSLAPHRSHEAGSGEPWSSEPRDPPPAPRPISEILESSSSAGQSSAQMWYSLTHQRSHSPSPLSRALSRSEPEESRPVIPPSHRLRRGGVRAPESILMRRSSSSVLPSPQSLLSEPARSDEESREWRMLRNAVLQQDTIGSEEHEVWAAQETTEQLLTPRSISPVGTGSQ